MPRVDLICVCGLFLESNLLAIERSNDTKCLEKLEGLEIKKVKAKSQRIFLGKAWGYAPA